MKYLTAIFAMFFLVLLDILIMAGMALLFFIPIYFLIEDGKYPISYKFAKGVWLDSK